MRRFLHLLAIAIVMCSGCREKVPVGFIAGLSGSTSEQGMSERDGARLFVESRGHRLITCDTRTNPQKVSRCVEELADSGVRVVVGPMYSSEAESAIAAATRRGIVLVAPTVASNRFSRRDDALVRVIGSNLDEADALAGLLLERGIAKPVLVWTSLNEAYLLPMVERICSIYVKRGHERPIVHKYASSLELEFDSIVATHAHADAFVSMGTPMEAALLARSLRRSGSKALLVGCQSSVGKDLLRMGGVDVEGTVLTAFTELVDRIPERIRFAEEFRIRFGRKPSWAAALGWEAAAISEPGWNATSMAQAKSAILRLDSLAPLGVPIRLDGFGDVRRSIHLHEVRNGQIELLAPGGPR